MKKLKIATFLVVLCDGSMDKSVTEQEVMWLLLIQKQESELLRFSKLFHHPKVKMHLDLRKQ